LTIGALASFTPAASAQPGFGASALAGIAEGARAADLQQVQYYSYRHRYRHRYNPGPAIVGGIIGLTAGALAAAAAAPPPAYYPDQDWIDYCYSKYRSFDAASGTYLGYDGQRHPCQ
jgi:hypothetical protein